ncbi:MAG: hypothetical protein KAG61_12345 [Bacteriovoracaceae bacterium]|nr:hypothetical protein [Bacteriovoracaceae bacterium]
MKPTKFQRIQELKRVLQSSGKLNKDLINIRVSNSLGCSIDLIARAIYRDLDELVRTNVIREIVYTRDMRVIDEYDPQVHRNVIKEWCIPQSEGKVIGHKSLESAGGSLFCPKFLLNDVYLTEGVVNTNDGKKSFFFSVGTSFLGLHISDSCLPVKLVLSRSTGEILTDEIDEINRLHGIRSIIVKLPVSSISAFSKGMRAGHLCIELLENSTIELTDLNSSNGSFAIGITPEYSEELISACDINCELTAAEPWSTSLIKNTQSLPISDSLILKLPAVAQLSSAFALLIK